MNREIAEKPPRRFKCGSVGCVCLLCLVMQRLANILHSSTELSVYPLWNTGGRSCNVVYLLRVSFIE